jgi:lambda repressor-like predicted transcriptional regulator
MYPFARYVAVVFKLMLLLRYLLFTYGNMTRRQIIGSIMAITGKTVAMLAAEHKYTKQAFYDVIRGRTRTPHLRALIAKIIGRPEGEIWPEKGKNTAIFECSNRNP